MSPSFLAPFIFLIHLCECHTHSIWPEMNFGIPPEQMDLIIDISALFKDVEPNIDILKSLLNPGDPGNRRDQLFYYETDLNKMTFEKIQKVSNWIKTATNNLTGVGNFVPEIFLTLRYNTAEVLEVPGGSIRVPKYSPGILQQLDRLKTFTKVAFEYTGQLSCQNKVETGGLPFLTIGAEILTEMYLNCSRCDDTLKLGYVINSGLVKCNYSIEADIPIDFFVIKFQFRRHATLFESYGVFASYMDIVHKLKVPQFLGPFMNNVLKYYHIQYFINPRDLIGNGEQVGTYAINNDSGLINFLFPSGEPLLVKHQQQRLSTLKIVEKYHCLFQVFLREWISSETVSAIVSASDFFRNCSCLDLSLWSSNFIPKISDYFSTQVNGEESATCDTFGEVLSRINVFREQGFHSAVASARSVTDLRHVLKAVESNCKTVSQFATNSSMQSDGIISVGLTVSGEHKLTNTSAAPDIADGEIWLGMRVDKVIIALDIFLSNDLSQEWSDLDLLQNNTSFSCRKIIYSETNVIRYLWDHATSVQFCKEIILHFDLHLESSQLHFSWSALLHQHPSKQLKQKFLSIATMIQAKWPDMLVKLSFELKIDSMEDLYIKHCSQVLFVLGEYLESIFNWALIYDIPVIFRMTGDPISFDTLVPDLKQHLPLFLRRRYNMSKVFRSWKDGPNYCLDWIDKVHEESTGMEVSLTGTVLYSNLRTDNGSLTQSEITTTLIFAGIYFPITEVVARNYNELVTILDTLGSENFGKSFKQNLKDGLMRSVFINVPITDINVANISNTLIAGINNVSSLIRDTIILRIHFPYSSEQLNETSTDLITNLMERLRASNVDIGLVLDDCDEIVRTLESKEDQIHNRSMNETTLYKTVDKIPYVVCTTQFRNGMVPFNDTKLHAFVSSNYRVKRILQIFFPNLQEIYFKILQTKPSLSNDTKEVVVFVREMIEYSKMYRTPYFLLPSFPRESSLEYSWWEISNYSDLSDPEVFQDMGSKTLNRDPWRPIIVHPRLSSADPKPMEQDINWLVYGLILAVGLLFIGFSATVLIRIRSYSYHLSNAEVQEFRNGSEEENKDSAKHSNDKLVRGKYNDMFEIPKNTIFPEMNNVLGKGNFGIVMRATIKTIENIFEPVAVKMPRVDCDKQTFIGMLHEIKLFCYLGHHQHLVKFIGCYTREIQRDVLYVVMELCSGGSLLVHLQTITTTTNVKNQSNVTAELIRFCHEIATGMEYISSKNVVHGDLSARNVLLDKYSVCKISDLGLSRNLYHYQTYTKKSKVPLPWRWMAFETLKAMEFSVMSDVWSFGVTTWEIFSLGDVPYPGHIWTSEFMKDLEEGFRLTIPKLATTVIYEEMMACWTIEPEQRPTFPYLVNAFKKHIPYAYMP